MVVLNMPENYVILWHEKTTKLRNFVVCSRRWVSFFCCFFPVTTQLPTMNATTLTAFENILVGLEIEAVESTAEEEEAPAPAPAITLYARHTTSKYPHLMPAPEIVITPEEGIYTCSGGGIGRVVEYKKSGAQTIIVIRKGMRARR